jgi:uncharacterized protein Yka (UPF0111/DUF47 family)
MEANALKKVRFDYFDVFTKYAECAVAAAEKLWETLRSFENVSLEKRIKQIHEIENRADELSHRVSEQLAREFLPPIDGEDIMALCNRYDDVVDAIDDILRNISMYNIARISPDALRCCEHLIKCCSSLSIATDEFRNFKKSKRLKDYIIEVRTLETEGDNLHFHCVKKLFDRHENLHEAIMWKDIFDTFEKCFDACDEMTQFMERVVLKNS